MCGQEYERRREMAAAALAYKCVEVAYMRVVYCKHSTSGRDWNELQATLQMVPQGKKSSDGYILRLVSPSVVNCTSLYMA